MSIAPVSLVGRARVPSPDQIDCSWLNAVLAERGIGELAHRAGLHTASYFGAHMNEGGEFVLLREDHQDALALLSYSPTV